MFPDIVSAVDVKFTGKACSPTGMARAERRGSGNSAASDELHWRSASARADWFGIQRITRYPGTGVHFQRVFAIRRDDPPRRFHANATPDAEKRAPRIVSVTMATVRHREFRSAGISNVCAASNSHR